MDVVTRYERKVLQFCGGLDPYKCRETFLSTCLPTHVEDYDVRNYFIHRESQYSLKEFAALKSLESVKFYEAGWVQSISGKKIFEDFVVLGKVSCVHIGINIVLFLLLQ